MLLISFLSELLLPLLHLHLNTSNVINKRVKFIFFVFLVANLNTSNVINKQGKIKVLHTL